MLIGFDEQRKFFRNIIENKALGQAYIFSGPSQIGKYSFALEIFELANNRSAGPENPDLKISGTFIEDIRDLKNFASITSFYGPYKFIIINDADNLTAEASNALLKILEEPSASTKFILVSSRPTLLLDTVRSRCQEIPFKPDHEAVKKIALGAVSAADQNLLITLARGRVGWLISVLENKKIDVIKKSIGDFQSVLGKGILDKVMFAKKVHEAENIGEAVNYWLSWAYADRREIKNLKLLSGLLELHSIVSQPQFNHRLALENFLINV